MTDDYPCTGEPAVETLAGIFTRTADELRIATAPVAVVDFYKDVE